MHMSVLNRLGVGLLVAGLLWFGGKTWSAESGEPYLKGRELERKLLMKGGEITYADPAYLLVARELNKVPFWSSDYQKAREKLQKIQAARRLALNADYKLDYLPESLQGTALASLAPEQLDRNRPPAPVVAQVPPPPVPPMEASGAGSSPTVAMATVAAENGGGKAEKASKPVVMYSTSWCGFCRRARAYFQAKGIAYVDKDVEQDPVAAREATMKAGGYGGVPVIDIDGTIIQGFDLPQIEAALARRKS